MHHTDIVFSVRKEPDCGFVAEAIGHAIVTQAETMEELRRMVADAVNCHFDPAERPRVIRFCF